jgi:hypothetical protein
MASDAESVELAPAAPAGLTVRRVMEAVDGGPFRGVAGLVRNEISFRRGPVSEHRLARIAIWVAPIIAILSAVGMVFTHWNAISLLVLSFLIFVWAAGELFDVQIPKRNVTLVLTRTTLELPFGKRLELADVRRVDVVRTEEGHSVVVQTPEGAVTTPPMSTAAQARYLAAEIDAAYLAFLRLRLE